MRLIDIKVRVSRRSQGTNFDLIYESGFSIPAYDSSEISPAFIIKHEEKQIVDKAIYTVDGKLYHPYHGYPKINWGATEKETLEFYIEPKAEFDQALFDNGTHHWVDFIVVDGVQYRLVSEPYYYVTKRGKKRTLNVTCELLGGRVHGDMTPAYNANELQDALALKNTSLSKSSRYYFKGSEWIEVLMPELVTIPARSTRVSEVASTTLAQLQEAVNKLQECVSDGTNEDSALAAINLISKANEELKSLGF